ncbi:MAG: hypothetical protein KAJ10_05315 [Thermodesulfovibrionia bacterium]|nr:hypothetical protein [Thermodesulfovibrionia bacterium]
MNSKKKFDRLERDMNMFADKMGKMEAKQDIIGIRVDSLLKAIRQNLNVFLEAK